MTNFFDRFRKKSIEITCPSCGGNQSEPALAFSTYCRTCGEHLKLLKGEARVHSGPSVSKIRPLKSETDTAEEIVEEKSPEETPAAATPKSEPKPETVASPPKASEPEPEPAPATAQKESPAPEEPERRMTPEEIGRARLAGKDPAQSGGNTAKADETPVKKKGPRVVRASKPKPKPEEVAPPAAAPEPDQPASVAEVFGLADAKALTESLGPQDLTAFFNKPREDGGGVPVVEGQLGGGSMEALIADLVNQPEEVEEEVEVAAQPEAAAAEVAGKAKATAVVTRKRPTRKNEVKARCFRCHHDQFVSKYAESTQCGRCNTYISLIDYNIRQPTDRVIRTRGNVVIHRRGSLVGPELACRDLYVMGPVTARIDCSGEARFKHSSSVRGQLYCDHLIIEKGAVVEFLDGVVTRSAQIAGTFSGNLTAAGAVMIGRTGVIDGDVVAHAVDMGAEGIITGQKRIDPNLEMVITDSLGYDPSVIE